MPWLELTDMEQQPIYVNTDRFDGMKWFEENGGYTGLKQLVDKHLIFTLTVRETPQDIIRLATGQEPRSVRSMSKPQVSAASMPRIIS